MIGRGLIVITVAVYLVGVACALLPNAATDGAASAGGATAFAQSAPAAKVNGHLAGLPYRSIGMQIQRVDWIEEYKQSIDEIADVGADTVLLVVDTRQENGSSSRIYLDLRMTPTVDHLKDLVGRAKQRGLRVILMPVVLLDNPRGNEWRGTIKPESWDEWWDSYRSMITHYAWVCQSNGVDVLVVGSELVSTEDKDDEWAKTIAAIRKVFKGHLTYSSNWDHYTSVSFWGQLDLIGMNSYWKLGPDHNVSVDQIVQNWKAIQHGHAGKYKGLLEFVKKKGKPLMFLEVGWCSLANMAHEPWDYTKTSEPLDLELQRKLYEGFFKVWHGNPLLGGFSVWEWTPGEGGPDHRGYTPENKPAEQVLREWLSKPRWKVK